MSEQISNELGHEAEQSIGLQVEYNLAQELMARAKQEVVVLQMGRAGGKSNILARKMLDFVTSMPRGHFGLVGSTYEQLKSKLIPNYVVGLSQHGIIENLHFFVGKKPPPSWKWPKPFIDPQSSKNAIYFYNGCVFSLISLEYADSGRGANLNSALGDEALLYDPIALENNVVTAIRGDKFRVAVYPDGKSKYFKDTPFFQQLVLATSAPRSERGKYILKYEKLAKEKPHQYAYIKADSFINLHNLGEKYIRHLKETMSPAQFNAEIMNILPKTIENSFYPTFDPEQHTYDCLSPDGKTSQTRLDIDETLPLHFSFDWGTTINSGVVAQRIPGQIRLLNEFYEIDPKSIDAMLLMFCNYFKTHKNRTLYLYGDVSGNNDERGNKATKLHDALGYLTSHGWNVQLMTFGGRNPDHTKKHRLFVEMFSEQSGDMDTVSISKKYCPNLIISISNAPAKEGERVKIQKDKKSEKNRSIPQQHATHLSDAFDYLLFALYYRMARQTVTLPSLRIG